MVSYILIVYLVFLQEDTLHLGVLKFSSKSSNYGFLNLCVPSYHIAALLNSLKVFKLLKLRICGFPQIFRFPSFV